MVNFYWNFEMEHFCRFNNKPSLSNHYLCSMFYLILLLSAPSLTCISCINKLLNIIGCQSNSEVEFLLMKLRLTPGLAPMWSTSNWTFNAIFELGTMAIVAQFVRTPTNKLNPYLWIRGHSKARLIKFTKFKFRIFTNQRESYVIFLFGPHYNFIKFVNIWISGLEIHEKPVVSQK